MDTQAWLIATLGLMLPFMCWGVISRDTFIINLVITFYLIVVGISFGYHLLITLPVFIAILFGQNKDKHRQFVLQEWQKFGIEPIFPLSAKKRADYRWLRSRGFGRKEAKRSAGYFFYN